MKKLDNCYRIDCILDIEETRKSCPKLIKSFEEWLIKYSNFNLEKKNQLKLDNKVIYNVEIQKEYRKAIIDFVSGMSDNFAIEMFNEIISF